MAPIVQLFPNGVPVSDRAREEAKERQAEAERLRKLFLSSDYTNAIYGPEPFGIDDDELMPTPNTVAFDNGGYGIFDLMGRNVSVYASLREGDIDVVLGLPLIWLPGQKGDPDSERACQQIESAWENIDERDISMRAACRAFERGFAPLENVWDEHTRGAATGLISIVEMIDRPLDWFAFDYRNRPHFKRQDGFGKADVVQDYKVSFMRCGTLHSRWGSGYGEDAYPTVFAIDAHMKGLAREAERFGYMPIVITYPNTWRETGRDYQALKLNVSRQWKNYLLLPGEVDKVEYDYPTSDASYAAANATGATRLKIVAKYEAWLSLLIQGSQYSSGNQAEGSFARDAVASSDRLWKAPSKARCIEAMLNRNFVRPTMLVNNPTLEQSKWPRATLDAAFGEDVRLWMELFDQAARLKIPVSTVTWSERTKIPLAQPGEPVLEAPQSNLIGAPTETSDDPLAAAAAQFSEPDRITITLADRREITVSPDQMIYTENRGMLRAKFLQNGDVPTFKAA
jgi:hypothetical protein